MKVTRLDLIIFMLSGLTTLACTPQFNRKPAKTTAKPATGTTATTPELTKGTLVDPHVAGGGAIGTSTSFRVSGVNIGFVKKDVGNTPGNTVKMRSGIDGQVTE